MPVSTRRTNGSSRSSPSMSKQSPTTTSNNTATAAIPSSSAYTRTQLALLAIYPSILLVGSIFSLLDPYARAAPYSALTQSHPADQAPSYFARKSNAFNQYFVKILWLWITGAFAVFWAIHPLTGSPLSLGGGAVTAPSRANTASPGFSLGRRRAQALLRYSLVTALWIVTTQWFFGPPLIDRSFRLTGGKCELVEAGAYFDEPAKEFITATACKVAGGQWAGGHDISGHVFILILGSAFLAFETAPVIETLLEKGWAALEERQADESVQDGGFSVGKEGDAREWGISMGFISGVVGLALWMLLMTATYFHTWFEKFTGLVVAFTGLGLIYILPRYVPALDAIIGRPGV